MSGKGARNKNSQPAEDMSKTRIIIVGGGFGGVKCAQTLSRELAPQEAEIILFNRENHLVFSPLLAEVVGSALDPLSVVVPLRQLLPKVFCRTEDVTDIDLNKSEVQYKSGDGQFSRLPYDHVVIACGNAANLHAVPGMADHAFPLKNIGDAFRLRSHILEQLEKAEVSPDRERQRWHLAFIVVGGGYTGVEVAGEINDLVRSSARYFKTFGIPDLTVTLVHSREQILPGISPGLREFARQKLERAGVNLVLGSSVKLISSEGLELDSQRSIKGATVVSTIGAAPTEMVQHLPVHKEKGRLLTEPDMRLSGRSNAWAIGDCANIKNVCLDRPCPATGQFAERQGRQCARNIIRVLRGASTKPFSFKPLGELCSIGGHSAVAQLFRFHLAGFVAWLIWRGVYLVKLPTWMRRFQVGFDWLLLLLFPRDLSHLRTRPTDPVWREHYAPGDVIYQRGDPALDFYLLEKGEVEMVRTGSRDFREEVITILGPGAFFGERALLNGGPRLASARAVTPVQVLIMGQRIFTHFSGAMSPIQNALNRILNRVPLGLRGGSPEVHELLKRTRIKNVMGPVPAPLLTPTMTIRDVHRAFVDYDHEFLYVSSDSHTLEGVVSVADLIRARGSGGADKTPTREFMSPNPVVLTPEDTCEDALAAMREYRLGSFPVVTTKEERRLVGCIQVRHLMVYLSMEQPREFPVSGLEEEEVRLPEKPRVSVRAREAKSGTGIHSAVK